ncbi:tyrosine-type recombinase/integrase [Primorskyibacter sedentarius]|nr:tyrosine-type recombinase/integrase [Primorskyibacter sedentarius]
MARTKTPRYLQQRYRRWYAALDIPKDVREFFDKKPRFVQSLRTESQTLAEQRVGPIVAQWKRQIEQARKASNDPSSNQFRLAEKWREELSSASEDERENLEFVLEDVVAAQRLPNEKAEQRFVEVLYGETIRTTEKLDAWISTLSEQKQKTLDMKRSDILRFAERFPYTSDVSRKDLRGWIDHLLQEENLSSATVRRIVSACRGYWQYLQHLQLVTDEQDPFSGLSPSKKKVLRASARTKREPFTPAQVVKLWKAAHAKGDAQLGDLIWCAMWTGCRIEEICSLKLAQVEEDKFRIVDGKTNAGWREIPIHPKLKETFQRLANESADGFLLSGLPDNKYGTRSDAIGKRFGRLKKSLGYGSQLVFHSIRKTVITELERAGAPENVVADIVGHEKKTMTYGLYSGGASFENKRDTIIKLSYPV